MQALLDVLNEAVSEATDSAVRLWTADRTVCAFVSGADYVVCAWQADPVSLHVHPPDKVEILELTAPNTELFNKVPQGGNGITAQCFV